MLENLALTRRADLRPQQALSLYVLGGLAYDCGDYPAALSWAEECLALWVVQRYQRGVAVALQTLARVYYQMGDLAKAQNLLEEGMPLFRETSWPWGIAWNLSTLGWVATDQGDLARARAHFAESLAIWRELGVPVRMIEVLEGFAQLAQAEARPGVAMRLAGLTTAQREALGSRLSPTEERRLQPRLERARQALTPAVAETAWAAGRDISLDDAVAEVLDVATNARLTPVADDQRAPLTAREREVAVLIARGLTNRGVAEALVITQRTAERHVENILGKLGLHTRAQIAVWAVQHDLVPAAARQDG
jgi:DNA-binding CsgD family transcriptional regulator